MDLLVTAIFDPGAPRDAAVAVSSPLSVYVSLDHDPKLVYSHDVGEVIGSARLAEVPLCRSEGSADASVRRR